MSKLPALLKHDGPPDTALPGDDGLGAGGGMFVFRLYIAGRAPHSLRAMANLTAICEDYLIGRYEIELIDILIDPLRALADDILLTPTLVKIAPQPVCQIVGSLSDRPAVLLALGIEEARHG